MSIFVHSLRIDSYFSLDGFPHPQLFQEGAWAWEPLRHLLAYLEEIRLGRIEGEISPEAHLVLPEKISIGPGSLVEPGAYIQGPCILGANCVVRHGAYIRGGVIAGDGVVIGHATEVKHSILLNGAKAPHFAYVGDSILGNDVNLGAGCRLANLRLDREQVVIRRSGERIETGLRKLGAILGDGVQLGCNCVTNPGTLLPRGFICLPNCVLKGADLETYACADLG